MNATKRKFNALLQGIGTRPTGSVSTADKNDAQRASSLDSGDWAASENLGDATTAETHPSRNTVAANTMLFSSASQPATTAMATKATTTSSAVANLEFLAKRRRIANGGAMLRDTSGNAVTAPSSTVLRKWGATDSRSGGVGGLGQAPASIPPAPAPRYCPGDREQLLRRLATFQELTDWTPKPDRINEIEWAKRGWVCQGRERLRCTLCSKELVVRLSGPPTNGADAGAKASNKDTSLPATVPLPVPEGTAETALVKKYTDLIVSAHQDDCLWQKKGCADSLLRLPLASPRQALVDLRQRYDELCARKDFLPYEFNLRLPDGLDIDAVLASLPPTFFDAPPPSSPSPPSPSPNRVALALAVMGWQGLTNSRIGAVPNSASCQACLRRLGLWMFKSKQVDLETNTVLEPAPMDHLDGVQEHRFFCPWRNGIVQRNPGAGTQARQRSSPKGSRDVDGEAMPGWHVLVEVLRNDAYLRNRVSASTKGRPLTATGERRAQTGASNGTATEAVATPTTPLRRPATAVGRTPGPAGDGLALDGDEDDEDDEAARDAKDKERWARLRRVKSLFDTKGTVAKKLRRAGVNSGSSSRPGTAASRSESQGQP